MLSPAGPAGHAATGRPPRYCSPPAVKARYRQRTREVKRAARPATAGALTQVPAAIADIARYTRSGPKDALAQRPAFASDHQAWPRRRPGTPMPASG